MSTKDNFWIKIIYIVSVIISGAVAFLILGPRPEGVNGSLDVSILPKVNASINAVTTLLNLYSEHELNASTLCARVVASSGASFHCAISSAIGALSGALHGGANEKVIPFLEDLSISDYKEVIDIHFESGRKIMGFGHAIYKNGDPRSDIAYKIAESVAIKSRDQTLLSIAKHVEEYVFEKKGLHPNLDYYAALALHFMGMKKDYFTVFFVYSRALGWASHILEQKKQKQLIRPRAVYQ